MNVLWDRCLWIKPGLLVCSYWAKLSMQTSKPYTGVSCDKEAIVPNPVDWAGCPLPLAEYLWSRPLVCAIIVKVADFPSSGTDISGIVNGDFTEIVTIIHFNVVILRVFKRLPSLTFFFISSLSSILNRSLTVACGWILFLYFFRIDNIEIRTGSSEQGVGLRSGRGGYILLIEVRGWLIHLPGNPSWIGMMPCIRVTATFHTDNKTRSMAVAVEWSDGLLGSVPCLGLGVHGLMPNLGKTLSFTMLSSISDHNVK